MTMLIETFLRQQVEKAQFGVALIDARTALDIADWIERHRETESVVRCKDCKHKENLQKGTFGDILGYDGKCNIVGMFIRDNCYCAWGERREDG